MGISRIPFPSMFSFLREGPDTRQWRERKQRPTSFGDKKNRPKPKKEQETINLSERLNDKREMHHWSW